MMPRRPGAMGECEARTQGAPIVVLSGQPRTTHRAAQRGRAAQASYETGSNPGRHDGRRAGHLRRLRGGARRQAARRQLAAERRPLDGGAELGQPHDRRSSAPSRTGVRRAVLPDHRARPGEGAQLSRRAGLPLLTHPLPAAGAGSGARQARVGAGRADPRQPRSGRRLGRSASPSCWYATAYRQGWPRCTSCFPGLLSAFAEDLSEPLAYGLGGARPAVACRLAEPASCLRRRSDLRPRRADPRDDAADRRDGGRDSRGTRSRTPAAGLRRAVEFTTIVVAPYVAWRVFLRAWLGSAASPIPD